MIISPRFRSLTEVLDREKMTQVFQEHLPNFWGKGLKITDCVPEQIFPKPRQLWIKYRIEVENRKNFPAKQIYLYGQLYFNGRGKENYSRLKRQGSDVFYLPELDMVFPVFPSDRRLTQLALCCSPSYMKKYFEKTLFPGMKKNYKVKSCGIQVQSYRLEKRCTICYDLMLSDSRSGKPKNIQLQAKISTPSLSRSLYDRLLSLRQSQVVPASQKIRIPTVIYHDSKLNAIFFEHIPGEALHEIMSSSAFLASVRQLPSFLSHFQSRPVMLEDQHSLTDELEVMKRWYKYLRLVFPSLRSVAGEAYSKIVDLSSLIRSRSLVPAHRDFHDKQILKNGRYLYILDWDLSCLADPALDLGNFLAHLELRSFQHPEFSPTLERAEAMLLEDFNASHRRSNPKSLEFYRLCSLFRLACVYAFRPKWHFLAGPLLNQCLNSNQIETVKRSNYEET